MPTTAAVDSYRFMDGLTTRLVKAWIGREPVREIPWTPLGKPLAEARIALISTAGIAPAGAEPFDQQGERDNPWWGDPSFRSIPATSTAEDVSLYHLHIDTSYGERDLSCVLPSAPLASLVAENLVGSAATVHYSYMGYILEPRELLEEHLPPVIAALVSDEVDLVLLAPV